MLKHHKKFEAAKILVSKISAFYKDHVDTVIKAPLDCMKQEGKDIINGKSDYISYNTIKMVQDTICAERIGYYVSGTVPNKYLTEGTKHNISMLLTLLDIIFDHGLQERPAIKKHKKLTLSPESYSDTTLKDFNLNM